MGYRKLKGWEVLEIVDHYTNGGNLATIPIADMAERYGVTSREIFNVAVRWDVPMWGRPVIPEWERG